MPEDEGFLRGPTVSDSAPRTLVNIDVQGRFVALPGRPEVAAVELVIIDAQSRERAREVAAARVTALGMFLVDHIDLVREATDALRSGEEARAREIYRKVYDQFDPDQDRSPLLEDLGRKRPSFQGGARGLRAAPHRSTS